MSVRRAARSGRRRAADASVLACAGVLVIFAFLDSLWWVVGSSGHPAGIPQLSLLLIILAVPFLCCPSRPRPYYAYTTSRYGLGSPAGTARWNPYDAY
jgi:hypothetical protein